MTLRSLKCLKAKSIQYVFFFVLSNGLSFITVYLFTSENRHFRCQLSHHFLHLADTDPQLAKAMVKSFK